MIDRSARARRARLVALGVALFVSYAWFYEAGGWNQNSRFDLVRAILGHHTLRIDDFAFNTGDKAVFDGHTYSDKAPGLALTALPAVAVARPLLRATTGVAAESPKGLAVLSYIATVATSGVATALAGVCLAVLAGRLFGSEAAGTFAAVVFGLGTPAWAYATLFQGHALATAGLLVAFMAAVGLGSAAPSGPRLRSLGLLVGLAAGWATVTELTSAIPAVIIAALALWTSRKLARPERRAVAFALLIGAVACVAVLLAYNTIAFGSPLHIGYTSEAGFAELKTGFFGITYPKPHVMAALIGGWFRGLIPLSPILALVPVGWWCWWRTRQHLAPLVVSLLIPLYYLCLNAGYYYWEGGWSYGPRHMAPSLAFLALALAPLWIAAGRSLRYGLAGLAIVSVGLTLIGVAVTPQPPSVYDRPMAQLWWPAFQDDDLSVNHTTFDMAGWNPEWVRHHPEVHAAWNLGERAGLHGRASLVPLIAVWIIAAGWWFPSGPKPVAARTREESRA